MGDRKSKRDRRDLRVRRQTLQVLGWSDLEHVVGVGKVHIGHEFARWPSRICNE
jgi:hypothetical protein